MNKGKNKILTILLIVALCFSSLGMTMAEGSTPEPTPSVMQADEVSPTPEATLTDTPTPTDEVTPMPEESPTDEAESSDELSRQSNEKNENKEALSNIDEITPLPSSTLEKPFSSDLKTARVEQTPPLLLQRQGNSLSQQPFPMVLRTIALPPLGILRLMVAPA